MHSQSYASPSEMNKAEWQNEMCLGIKHISRVARCLSINLIKILGPRMSGLLIWKDLAPPISPIASTVFSTHQLLQALEEEKT